MKKVNEAEVTTTILAAALGKSVETAQAVFRVIRIDEDKTVAGHFITVPNVAKHYKMPLDEAYTWLKMKKPE